MDSRLLIGLGVSVASAFGRYLFPSIPKPTAVAGLVSGGCLVAVAFLPGIRAGPAALAVVAIGLLAGAITWQLTFKSTAKPQTRAREIAPAAAPGPKAVMSRKRLGAIQPSQNAPRSPAHATKALDDQRSKKEPKAVVFAEVGPPPAPQELTLEDTMTDVTNPRPHRHPPDNYEGVLNQLRALWINSHDGISPEMMSGLEWPPENWLNEKLKTYGKEWRVRIHGANYETYFPEK